MKKRFLSILLAACLLVGMMPTAALAADGDVEYRYCDENGANWQTGTKDASEYTVVTSGDTEWTTGWYVVNTDVTIGTADTPQRITVSGNVHLILADGCTLTVNGGIRVQDDDNNPDNGSPNALIIYGQGDGTGTLYADSSFWNVSNAGIGGDSYGTGTGTITINGGTVTATGLRGGAGIGGGTVLSGGNITINGGTVTATGGIYGAGIGGGIGGGGGKITINGGTVTATGTDGAGIGGGSGLGDSIGGSGGTIIISGGTVEATSIRGAGIGGGSSSSTSHGKGGSGGTVTITGGIVTATSDMGAGIGGGDGPSVDGSPGTFQTTNSGNAVLFVSSIADQSNQSSWSGILFEGSSGTVYGDPKLTAELTIPADKTLTIPEGVTLTIPEGVTLTIPQGVTLTNNGTIINNGTITGTISGNQPVCARYLDANGTEQSRDSATVVTNSTTTWSTGWYVVTGDVTIGTADTPQRVTVSGDVHLILADGCDFTVNGGIQVQDDDGDPDTPSANALTIYAQSMDENTMGKLTVQNVELVYAGIGGDAFGHGGTVTINGGIVEATSIVGAGIGGGTAGSGGTITINGGIVKSEGDASAGIGGGDGGSGGTITINGGVVTATSWGGAGIGGGAGDGNGSDGGIITITGGIVEAKGEAGAGIGGGAGNHTGGSGGSVTITGGTVTAKSTDGAGIGGGYAYDTQGIGGSGTFQTNDGTAVLFASSIADKSNQSSWSGILFEGSSGAVYGDQTLAADLTIPADKTLTIPAGVTLTIPQGVTLTNEGSIYVDGTFAGTSDNIYYLLTLVNATAAGDTSDNNNQTYAKAGSVITLTPDAPAGCVFTQWVVTGSHTVTVDADNKFIMPNAALKITAQWNDVTAPVISGIENGKIYCAPQTMTVSDNDGIASVTVNGSPVTLDTNGQFTLNPATGTQTVIATDNAGNEMTVTVTVNAGHTDESPKDHICDICGADVGVHQDTNLDHVCDYGCSVTIGEHKDENNDHVCDYGCSDPIGDHVDVNHDHVCDYGCTESIGEHKAADGKHTCDYCGAEMTTCKDDDKNHLCDICGITLSQHSGGAATCTSKAICDYCGKEYGEVDSTKHNLEKIPAKDATVTETGNKEYWHCKDCGSSFSDQDGKNGIEAKDTVTQKLPPEVIEGTGQSLTAGDKKDLTFRSNAAFSDFIRVELDGSTLDPENYTATEGSIIISLKADYVGTLSAGEHTIGIVSASGTASATFTITARTDNGNSQTGDNSHLALWAVLAFASGSLLVVTGVSGKRKRNSVQ